MQCDIGKDSFIAAYRLSDGQQIWKTPREEIPSWGTPTIVVGPERTELVTGATKFARGYDPDRCAVHPVSAHSGNSMGLNTRCIE